MGTGRGRGLRAIRTRIAIVARSLQVLTLVGSSLFVMVAMLVTTDRARSQADRARHAQLLLERVRTGAQQSQIVALRSGRVGDKEVAKTLRPAYEGYKQLVISVRALRGMDVAESDMRELEARVGTAYGLAMNSFVLSQVNPRAGQRLALTRVSPALDRVGAVTVRAATRQDRVVRSALHKARIAGVGSLAIGLVLLALLGWRLHWLQRAEQARAAERRGEERLRALVRHSSDLMVVLDAEARVRWIADSVRTMLGYEPEELLERPFTGLVHPDQAEAAERFVREAARGQSGSVIQGAVRLRNSAGEYRDLEVVADNRLADPLIDGILVTIHDISERLALLEELRHQAFHDSLTGLPNRALLEERLTHALTRLPRREASVALMFVDLDDFKAVNDGLGHASGDELLCAIGRRLEASLRAHDTPARLGGDEFAVLLEDLSGEAEALEIAERVRIALEQPLTVAGHRLTSSASVGVACALPGDTAEDVLRNADVAMYSAKESGKGRVAACDAAMHARAVERFELSAQLEDALGRDELVLDYQPIVCTESASIVGFEALLRWEHPVHGRLYPDRFIALAESNGLIVPIGALVLGEACAQLRRWQDAHPDRSLGMSVNVSARQLADGDLPQQVRAALERSGVAPHQLTLEITENVLVEDREATQRQLRELKQIGVRLAVDDFGTGYSALSYLRSFPLDVLKIDRAFVSAIHSDRDNARLVRGIVDMAHSLGLEVVTEGIEELAEAALVRVVGSDFSQGYFFSRPVDAAAIGRLLADAGTVGARA